MSYCLLFSLLEESQVGESVLIGLTIKWVCLSWPSVLFVTEGLTVESVSLREQGGGGGYERCSSISAPHLGTNYRHPFTEAQLTKERHIYAAAEQLKERVRQRERKRAQERKRRMYLGFFLNFSGCLAEP